MIRSEIKHMLAPLAFLLATAAFAQDAIEPAGTAPIEATDPAAIVKSSTINLEPFVTGLEGPWSIAWLPDGRALVTELPGRLRIISAKGKLEPKPVAGLPAVFAERQGGLLDIAIDPDFATNRYVYFSYAHGQEEANRTRVARARLARNKLTDLQVIFEVKQTKSRGQHYGSRLAFLPDKTLLVSIGDGGNPPASYEGRLIREQAQNLDTYFGKIIRINRDGSTPLDNPLLGRPEAAPEIWSYGHRNVQGLFVDSPTGRIYSSEHGPQGGDEVNVMVPGGNYGWPLVTHGTNYGDDKMPVTPHKSLRSMVDPIMAWTPSIGASGLILYRGDKYPDWDGDLLSGGLRVSGRPNPGGLFRIDLDAQGRVVGQSRFDIPPLRVRDIRTGPDGFLYMLTTDPEKYRTAGDLNGAIWRIVPK
jgi:aldose sugar dehydrogenase